jgi:hypothetical protein
MIPNPVEKCLPRYLAHIPEDFFARRKKYYYTPTHQHTHVGRPYSVEEYGAKTVNPSIKPINQPTPEE